MLLLPKVAVVMAAMTFLPTTTQAFMAPMSRRATSPITTTMMASSVYDFNVKDASGKDVALPNSKVLLIVNVASQCGFTPQYAELQALQDKYGKGQDFSVVAFPCNQFGGQEPGTAQQVCEFAETYFKTTFPIMDKVEVNGPGTIPLYDYLKQEQGGFLGSGIKWNFSKFLVKDGKPIKRYGPQQAPSSFEADIKEAISS